MKFVRVWGILGAACITLAALLFTVFSGGFIGFPLTLGLLLFSAVAWMRGLGLGPIWGLWVLGAKKALVVLRVFAFIGGITGLWLVSGTVPALINLGFSVIHPQFFLLFAFLIPAVISYLLGTSFGTISTVGIALMFIAKGAGLNEALVGGAIISGAYFGDRNSPMSSSANLVASLTKTDLHGNVVLMFKTGLVPLVLSILFFGGVSVFMPEMAGNLPMLSDLRTTFDLGLWAFAPAAVMLVLSLSRLDVKVAMGSSMVVAALVAWFYQGADVGSIVESAVFGFRLPPGHILVDLIKGGGLMSMAKPAVIVTVACALAGLLEGAGLLDPLEARLWNTKKPGSRFFATLVTSLGAACFGCNQTIAIVLTEQLMKKRYTEGDMDGDMNGDGDGGARGALDLAIDIENTAVVLAPLVPWNIAGLVPTTALGISSMGFIPFAVFLYLVPMVHWVRLLIKDRGRPIPLSPRD